MFLALKEMSRAKTRFGLLVAAIALLVFLILFQQSLQNGLITGFVGAIRNQNAPVLVYSVDGQRVIQGSIITPDLEAEVRDVDGLGTVGRLGQGTFTATSTTSSGDSLDATILGYELGDDGQGLGAPSELVDGRYPSGELEAVGSTGGDDAFAVGDTVVLQPGGFEIEIVGVADDIQLNVSPTLFVSYSTWSDAVQSVNPDAGEPLPNVMVAAPAEGVTADQLVTDINDRSLDLDALTRDDAASETPGVAQVQQSFQLIFLLYGLVVPCVTGLFFLIVTLQKADALTLLRAIGAPAKRLVASLLIQVVLMIGGGLVIGTALYFPLTVTGLGGLELRFETGAVLFWSILLLTLGVASSLVAARRVLRIDPIEATTGAGVGA
ncbi:ABC transporter permease [Ilumatobacter nonamiensis]|uniref:ABC transporter permease n=1 Tax=Ilumatobacter nonamiensis TaxID=467093 RepID=UPI0003499A9A|nr:ABC transporter permease [Ilumatobacter nonamiensis]